jgi:toxin-antitoxin system PIN domain toxin
VILPDVNVLIYAFRRDLPHHEICRAWLVGVVSGEARFGVSPVALSAVVRITTNARAFKMPSASEEAFGFCEDLLRQRHCELVEPGERHWSIFRDLCIRGDVRGSRVADAWYAALAIEWGCEWITFDRDYARFPGLKWRLPAAQRPA